jgi:hypothetical protein
MAPFFCKVNLNLVALNGGNAANAPGPVKHVITLVKSNVLFKVADSFVDFAVILGKVRYADILFQLAVGGILFPVALDNFTAGVNVALVILEDDLDDGDGGVYVIILAYRIKIV